MLITLIRAVRRAAVLTAGAVTALTWLPAAAQSWSAGGCSGCHTTPPSIASSIANGVCGTNYTIGVNEGFLASAGDLLARVNAAGTTCGVPQMQAANFTNAASVFTYLTNLHHGTVSGSAPSIGSSKVGVAKNVGFSFTLTNYREVATSFTVTNAGGNAPGEYQVISFAASGAAGCSGSSLPAATTESGVSCTISGTVRFTPTTTIGSRTTTLTAQLTSAPAGQARNVYGLSGTGVLPNFAISPTSHAFTAKVGTTVQQTFTISNSGSVPLDLTSIGVSPAPQYIRPAGVAGGTCSVASDVAGGGSCTVIVQFAPSAAGAAPAGTISIGHDGGNVASPATVNLSGTGTVPTLSPSIATLPFDNSQLGVPKVLNGVITLTNTGDADLVLPANPFSLGGTDPGDFSFGGTCGGATVAPGNTCSVNGTFTPGGLGPRSATLTIDSDASNGSQDIQLTGTGVALPEPIVTFPATDFPDTVIGETAAQTREITIRNDRTLDIGYSVANTADFNVLSHSCAGNVVPGGGGTCTLTLQFQPPLAGGEGRRQADLTATFSGTGGNPAPSSVVGSVAGHALLPLGLPAPTLTPTAVVGTPGNTSLLLTNRSAVPLTLDTLTFGGTAPTDYTLAAANTCTAGLVLASGANCSLLVRFDPPAAGTRSATLTLAHTGLGSPQVVTLNGTATPAPQGEIALGALAMTFPSTQLNGSAAQSITVRNVGNLVLTFSAFDLAGPAAADYERGGTCATASPLAIDAQCTLTLTFRPTALGARSASLAITSDASNGPVTTIALSGTGVPIPVPQVTLAPAALDFGAQTVGNLYPARTIRLSNSGTADLVTSGIAVDGTAFAAGGGCPGTLPPGAGCDIQIAFTPAAATPYTGTLRVTSNAAGSPHTVALAGQGSAATLAALRWSPAVAELAFGDVAAGTVSAGQTVTLLNQGPGGVTLNVLNAVGPGAASFAVSGGTCQVGASLFEGQTCTIDVHFAPALAGLRQAEIQVASTGSFPPMLALRGTGLGGPAAGLALSADAVDFGSARIGAQSNPSELTLSSSGSGTVQLTAISVDGPYAVQNRSCPALPFSLPAGASCTITLTFTPQTEGNAAGTLRVSSTAAAGALEISLSGEGEAAADVSSGGGCSIASGATLADPTLWVLALLAAAALLYRRRARRASGNAP